MTPLARHSTKSPNFSVWGWPGGPALERLAASGDPRRHAFPRPMLGREGCAFSFSGLKTAVARVVATLPRGALPIREAADIAAGFQAAVTEVLADRVSHAMSMMHGRASVLVASGGVAANQAVRLALESAASARGFRLVVPPVRLCTDNAVMIAWAGLEQLRLGLTNDRRFRAAAPLAVGVTGAVNYRHAYHAGNFADCMKHALLVALLRAMMKKSAPVFVLDTHAGAGHYDLDGDAARRTNEAAAGIARIMDRPLADLDNYVTLVRLLGLYPGSPELIRAMLRPDDRLACCEQHPEDCAALRKLFRRDIQVAVHLRDGWEALKALLPPAQKRVLVLIDPPYENSNEFDRLAEGLTLAHCQSPGAVLAAWYPVKHRAPVRQFFNLLSLRDVITAELLLREPHDPSRLNGCGLVIVNPPYQFEATARRILDALLTCLGDGEAGAAATVNRLTDE